MAKKEEIFNPELYMQMAIDAMHNSIPETRNDGKVSPKVGAVLIKEDGTIETASRGELRCGDHAEFTLLERKNRAEKLDGGILFATLEPCAPGARKHPKLGCAERIVNARIKEVWIGVEDPDPTVDRKGIKFLEDNGIKVKMFYPEFQKQINDANKDFLAQAIERANDVEEKKNIVLSPLETSVKNSDLNQFSEKAINYYIEKAKLPYKFNSPELWQHFENIGVLERVSIDQQESILPSGFGLLLFGENSREKYPQSVIKAKVKYGNNDSIPKDFEGPLVLIPKDIELWLEQVLHSEISREKFERTTNTLFPIKPLREAIINALVHRDYDLEGAKTYIEIDDSKITVKSAGLPVSPISLEDVKAFRASSLSRNPRITYVFNKMGLMEESDLGMETFRMMQSKYDLPLPQYDFSAPYLSLVFSRSIENLNLTTSEVAIQGLNNRELRGYEWVKSKEKVSKKEYAEHFKFDDKMAYRHLSKLKKLNLLTDNGEKSNSPNYRYIVTKE